MSQLTTLAVYANDPGATNPSYTTAGRSRRSGHGLTTFCHDFLTILCLLKSQPPPLTMWPDHFSKADYNPALEIRVAYYENSYPTSDDLRPETTHTTLH